MARKSDTRQMIVEKIAVKSGLRVSEATMAYDALVEIVRENILAERGTTLFGVGVITADKRPPKRAFSPSLGKLVDVPERIGIGFRPTRTFETVLRRDG